MRRLLSHRDARTYIAGQGLSVIGDSALWLAMGIWVKIALGAALIAAVNYRVLLLAMAAVFACSAGYLASRRREPADATPSCALQQADSMPR